MRIHRAFEALLPKSGNRYPEAPTPFACLAELIVQMRKNTSGGSASMDASQDFRGIQPTQLNTQVISSTRTSSLAITTSACSSASPRKRSIMDLSTPAADVSAFCQAVLSNVVPNEFWGSGHNKKILIRNVDRFVTMRRFESLTLHEVIQGMKVNGN